MSMPPTLATMSYHLIYGLGNHIKVSNVEEHFKTLDSGVVATFEHECISRPNDQILVLVKLKHVGWVEEILELNYGILKIVILLCNWVKVNYSRNSVTMKKNKYELKLVNFSPLISEFRSVFYFPIACRASFLFLQTQRKGLGRSFYGKNPTGGVLQKRKLLMSS
jgi:hypothetical protein